MSNTFPNKVQELKRIVKLHVNWLAFSILGENAISKTELEELEKYKKLPMDKGLSLTDKAYLLGRLRALTKKVEYKQISYEELASKSKPSFTELEELSQAQLKIRGQQYLFNSLNEIVNHVYDVFTKVIGEKKDVAQSTLSSLASTIKNKFFDSVKSSVKTELQRAKVVGQTQTIINKVDIYASSQGVESFVSVIPAKNCCLDCQHLYLNSDGNPKVFRLNDLLKETNVEHTKKNGVHTKWTAILPPLHRNCGCSITYIPDGYSWQSGKLELVNKSLFEESIQKARAGVSGGIASTVKPKGPPSASEGKLPSTPSVPGVAAPGNQPGPGRPSGVPPKPGSGTPGGAGGGKQLVACPFGGGADCMAHGGDGAEQHEASGKQMQEHQKAMMSGAEPKTEFGKEQQQKLQEAVAKQYDQKPHPQDEVKQHLESGVISSARKLGGKEAGINASFEISIAGNGRGLMKPPINFKALAEEHGFDENAMVAPGIGTTAPDMSPKAEVGAHLLSKSLGLTNVPVTVTRLHDGSHEAPRGGMSVQHWQENGQHFSKYGSKSSDYKDIVNSVPKEHQARLKEEFSNTAVMDLVINNGDRHFNNLLINKDSHSLIAIDHGTAFGVGLHGMRNDIAFKMKQAGEQVQIPEALHSRLKTSSLNETMRSLEDSNLPDWAKMQTHLRKKYAVHLQEKFGHIPTDRLRGTRVSKEGEVVPYEEQWGNGSEGFKNFFETQDARELPHQQFEGWAKAWINKVRKDPNHPDFKDAQQLYEDSPLRSIQQVNGLDANARQSDYDSYYSSIPDYDLDEKKYISKYTQNNKKSPEKLQTENKPIRVAPKISPALDHTDLSLDLSEFNEEQELSESDLEEIKPEVQEGTKPAKGKKKLLKSLWLSNPRAVFPLDELA